jgi:hypothetical protein
MVNLINTRTELIGQKPIYKTRLFTNNKRSIFKTKIKRFGCIWEYIKSEKIPTNEFKVLDSNGKEFFIKDFKNNLLRLFFLNDCEKLTDYKQIDLNGNLITVQI